MEFVRVVQSEKRIIRIQDLETRGCVRECPESPRSRVFEV